MGPVPPHSAVVGHGLGVTKGAYRELAKRIVDDDMNTEGHGDDDGDLSEAEEGKRLASISNKLAPNVVYNKGEFLYFLLVLMTFLKLIGDM